MCVAYGESTLTRKLISTKILVTFCIFSGTFFVLQGLYRQANTRPASRPPSGWSDFPERGARRRDDLARLLFFIQHELFPPVDYNFIPSAGERSAFPFSSTM